MQSGHLCVEVCRPLRVGSGVSSEYCEFIWRTSGEKVTNSRMAGAEGKVQEEEGGEIG